MYINWCIILKWDVLCAGKTHCCVCVACGTVLCYLLPAFLQAFSAVANCGRAESCLLQLIYLVPDILSLYFIQPDFQKNPVMFLLMFPVHITKAFVPYCKNVCCVF